MSAGQHILRAAMVTLRLLACVAITAAPAASQTNGQLWGSFSLSKPSGKSLVYDIEIEPKALVVVPEGKPGWGTLDVTPSVDFAARRWLDVIGELATGYTWQTDEVNTLEVTPRLGLRLHLTTVDLPTGPLRRERVPRHRIVVRDLIRIEARNLFYSDESSAESTMRFRNRLEFQVPLNREKINDDGTRYLLADWEWFIPLSDPAERFASRQRVRAGLGYRPNAAWHFEGLYIWGRSRDTTAESFQTTDHIVSFRVKRQL